MLIDGPDGSVELRLAGFQFPGTHSGPDADWFIVDGAVTTRRGEWRFRAPCLDVTDVAELASWLDAAARGAADRLEVTEPELAFELAGVAGDEVTVRVEFAHAALPPFARPYDEYAPGETFRPEAFDLRVDRADLARAAAALRAELRSLRRAR